MTKKRLQIDENFCKGCGLCLDACPRNLLEIQAQPNTHGVKPTILPDAAAQRCTACALCALVCPDTAISVLPPEPDDDLRN